MVVLQAPPRVTQAERPTQIVDQVVVALVLSEHLLQPAEMVAQA